MSRTNKRFSKIWLIAGITVFFLLLLASFLVRGKVVLGGILDEKLAALSEAANGSFIYEDINPCGIDGVEVRGLRFIPNQGDRGEFEQNDANTMLYIEAIQLFPAWRELIRGNQTLRRITLIEPEIDILLDSSGQGHVPWFDEITDFYRTQNAANSSAEDSGPLNSLSNFAIPHIQIEGGAFHVEDPSDVYPSFNVEIQRISLTPTSFQENHASNGGRLDGEVEILGLGRALVTGEINAQEGSRVGLQLLQDNNVFSMVPDAWKPAQESSFSIGSMGLAWPPEFSLSPVSLQQMNLAIPGVDEWRLDDLWARDIAFSIDQNGYYLDVTGIDATFAGIFDNQAFIIPQARLSRSWDQEQTYFDIQIADPEGEILRLRLDRQSSNALTTLRVEGENVELAPILRLLPETPINIISGEFSGEILMEWQPNTENISGYASFSIAETELDAPVISSEIMSDFETKIEAQFELELGERTFALHDATLSVGELPLEIECTLSQNEEDFVADLDVIMPELPAQTILTSLPVGFVPILQGFEFGGSLGFEANFHIDTALPEETVSEVQFHLETLTVESFGPLAPIPMFNEDEFTWATRTFEGNTRMFGPQTEQWVDFRHMPHHLYRAVIAAEDDGFWRHQGFEWRAIRRALQVNVEAGRFVRGGSTISQQVVKNLFLSHDRTFSRKLQELFLTWQLEEELSKTRILEIYLNLVHWGPGLYGITEAAMAYFEHVPRQVTLRESAFLASILPNPALFGEQYARSIVSPSRRQKMRNILRNMHRRGYITDERLAILVRLIERGNISMTPYPTHLQRIDPSNFDDEELPQFGQLFRQ